MKNILTLTALIIFTQTMFGQYLNWSPIEESDISGWETSNSDDYMGIYRFGDSEAESKLAIWNTGYEILAQVQRGNWVETGQHLQWVNHYDNLTNVRIDENGGFTSDQYQGEFVFYKDKIDSVYCLKLYDSWSLVSEIAGEYELGPKLSSDISDFFEGRFSEATRTKLTLTCLADLGIADLRIMRNEIFARYGYIFVSGGKMDSYFRKQDWYNPQHQNVDHFLTDLEKKNLLLIKEAENRLK